MVYNFYQTDADLKLIKMQSISIDVNSFDEVIEVHRNDDVTGFLNQNHWAKNPDCQKQFDSKMEDNKKRAKGATIDALSPHTKGLSSKKKESFKSKMAHVL